MLKRSIAVLAGVLVALAPFGVAGGAGVLGEDQFVSPDDVGLLPTPDDPDADQPAQGAGQPAPGKPGQPGHAGQGGHGAGEDGAGGGAVVQDLPGGPEDWIKELGSDSFATREGASQSLWRRGNKVLGLLEKASKDSDPEVAYRALELIRKIQLDVGPQTPEAVRKLVEEYNHSDGQKKFAVVGRLLREKAYKQVLRLFALEKDEEARTTLQELVKEVAPAAARQAILADDIDEARVLLEMAPADDTGLANLAAFHRARGTLQDELKRAAGLAGEKGLQWRLALHRAAGDIDAALADAQALGREDTVAGLQLLKGNPVPWFEMKARGDDVSAFEQVYLQAAEQRWRSQKVDSHILDDLVDAARKDQDNRTLGVQVLLALGEIKRAEELMKLCPPEVAFGYYDQAERVDEALASLGLDPAQPDIAGWAARKAEAITADDLDESSKPLLFLAEFLNRRGDMENLRKVLDPLFARLRKFDQPEYFLGTLGTLHATGILDGLLDEVEKYTAAGANPHEVEGRWAEIVETFFLDDPVVQRWWSYLGAGQNPPSMRERLRILDSLLGRSRQPQLATPWVERRWKEAQKATGAERESAMEMLVRVTCPLSGRTDRIDTPLALKVLGEMHKDGALGDYSRLYLHLLCLNNQWKEAAKICRELLETQPASLDLPQQLAVALRKSGDLKEAESWQRRAELLTLAHPTLLLTMASAHQNGSDDDAAARYLRQILVENDPTSPAWVQAITGAIFDPSLPQVTGLAEFSLLRRDWQVAAPFHEVLAANSLTGVVMYDRMDTKSAARLNADLARGLGMLKAGKEKQALEVLRLAGQANPGQGALADDYFPALREAKLTKLHDEMFELSWSHLQRALERYPNSDNTCNTLAWIGARAARRLDEADRYVQRALKGFPDQPAYLDTRAEVCFAKRNRSAAVEFSERAVAGLPNDAQIQRQLRRFPHADFPLP